MTTKDTAPATRAADPLRRKVEALRRWYASAREREFLGHAVATDLGFALDDTGDALPDPSPAPAPAGDHCNGCGRTLIGPEETGRGRCDPCNDAKFSGPAPAGETAPEREE